MKRTYIILCLLLAVLISLSAISGIWLSSGHDCMQRDCLVCLFLSAMEHLLHIVPLAAAATALYVYADLHKRLYPPRGQTPIPPLSTLFDLKVKLSN